MWYKRGHYTSDPCLLGTMLFHVFPSVLSAWLDCGLDSPPVQRCSAHVLLECRDKGEAPVCYGKLYQMPMCCIWKEKKRDMSEEGKKSKAAVFQRGLVLELGIEGWDGWDFCSYRWGQNGGSVWSCRRPIQSKWEERKVRNKMPVPENLRFWR